MRQRDGMQSARAQTWSDGLRDTWDSGAPLHLVLSSGCFPEAHLRSYLVLFDKEE